MVDSHAAATILTRHRIARFQLASLSSPARVVALTVEGVVIVVATITAEVARLSGACVNVCALGAAVGGHAQTLGCVVL